jgi:hypothetical protein
MESSNQVPDEFIMAKSFLASLIPRIKHPLAILHHIQFIDAKTSACFSPMHGSSWPSPY